GRRAKRVGARQGQAKTIGFRMRAKAVSVLALLFAAFTLSACDHCGDWARAQFGGTPMACKGDTPR
ncbi:MAG TPA: hypothetical protein VHD34_07900, partial [Xanthobacteraceae bacterium]|nr:hypothetical protein [Xanthobacteraceae bacterium]